MTTRPAVPLDQLDVVTAREYGEHGNPHPAWTRLRLEAITAEIFDDLARQGTYEGDFVTDIAARQPLRMITELLGIPREREEFVLRVHLARLDLQVFFRQFAERCESLELAGPVELLKASFVGGPKHVPVRCRFRTR